MNDFKGKKIGILGLGVEGLSSARFLVKNGADVAVLDQKTEKELDQEIFEEIKKIGHPEFISGSEIPKQVRNDKRDNGIKFILGKDYLKNLQDFDIIVRSPGIKRNLPEIVDAEKSGVVITSQTKIFFGLCPAKIIGVTGTKGKGTTCSLIYEMLKKSFGSAQGKQDNVYLGGNIGQPPLDFLDKLNSQSWVVLELSSFQLQDVDKSPHIAVVLMITSEHLDYHKDTKEYVEAKRNILRFQTSSDFAVINRDYPASNESDIHTKVKIFKVSRERETDEGCFVKNGKIVVSASSQNIIQKEIISTKDILLPGKHNWENVCAAVMAATLAGVSKQNIVSVLKTFKGLEHRLQLVGEIDGVKYYDDSFSTTPETAIAAIEAFEQPEILILGGSSKNSDFTELGKVISQAKNIKAIIGIGNEWKKMKESIDNYSSRERSESRSSKDSSRQARTIKYIEGCKNMREVVVSAALEAEPGDVVILSPACASFDMFKNYKDRGEQFKHEVEKLKERAFK